MNVSVWRYPNGMERTTAQTVAINEQNVLLVRPDTESYPGGGGRRGSIVIVADPSRGNLQFYHVTQAIDAVYAAMDTSGYPGWWVQATVESFRDVSVTGNWVKAAGTADTNTPNSLDDSGAGFIADGIQVGDIAQNITDGGTAQIIVQLYSGTADGNTANKLIDSGETFDGTKGFVGAIDSDTTLSIVDAAGDDLDLCPDGNEDYQIYRASGAVLSDTTLLLGTTNRTDPTFVDLVPDGNELYQIVSAARAAQQWILNTTFIERAIARTDGGTGCEVYLQDAHQMEGLILIISETAAGLVTSANAGTDDILESFSFQEEDGRAFPSARTIVLNKALIEKRIASYLGGSDTAVFVRRSRWSGSMLRVYVTAPPPPTPPPTPPPPTPPPVAP